MTRRSSSLNQIDSGLSREIGSNFDVIKKVAEKLAELEAIGSSELVTLSSSQLSAIASMTGVDVIAGIADSVTAISGSSLVALTYNEWLSILGITEAAQLIQNIEVQASSLPAGSEASATLTGSELVIGVPRAVDGVDGTDGLTPEVSLSVNGSYDLSYSVNYVSTDNVVGGSGSTLLNLSNLVSNAAGSYLTQNTHLFQGETGAKGETGVTGATAYIWVMYADNGTGSGISSSPVGKPYLGLAFNKGSSTPSNNPSDYSWSSIKGQDGDDGSVGATGVKGDQGISVHHMKGTSTTDLEGDFGTFGEWDTYTFYGDAAETLNIGHFTVRNGMTYDQMAEEGFMQRKTYDVNENGVVDNSEALGGKSLLQIEEERDIAIANAQLALGTNYTVSNNVERMLLEGLTASDKVFVVDDGDGKWAHYIVAAVTDGLGSTSTFTVIMDEDTYLNSNTKEGIKSSYESNDDTNAFTDSEKLLVGINTTLDTVAKDLTGAVNELHNELVVMAPIVAESEVHRTSDGSDHSFINQDVTNTADVTFNSVQVTTTVDGRDVSEDGSKLDTIEEYAKDDQSAEEVPVTPSGNMTSNNVQEALEEIQTDLDAHKDSTGEDHSFIDQDVTSTGTPSFGSVKLNGGTDGQGTISWNAIEDTLDVVLGNDSVLQVGEEHLVSVVNHTGSVIADGTPVMYVGSFGASGKVSVAPMDGSVPSNGELLVGMTTSEIPNGGSGRVTKFGKVRGIDTSGTPYGEVWSDGDILYVSSTVVGGLTNVEPSGAGVVTPVAAVVNSHPMNGTVLVRAIPINYNRPASNVYFEPVGGITSTDVQSAVEEVHSSVVGNTLVTGTSTQARYDKILSNLDVSEMLYTGDDLTTVRYEGDNSPVSYYREVLLYTGGNLTSIKHYYGTADLIAPSAVTTLSYDGSDNLLSTTYTE